jgi:hypothetical protein
MALGRDGAPPATAARGPTRASWIAGGRSQCLSAGPAAGATKTLDKRRRDET